MMDLEDIKRANANPQKWREETGRLPQPKVEHPDHGNFWPGKYADASVTRYGNPATAYKPTHGGYADNVACLSSACDEGRMMPSVVEAMCMAEVQNPVPGSGWTAEDVDRDKQERRTEFRAGPPTISQRLLKPVDDLEFDAVRLANTLKTIADETAVNYFRLSSVISEYRKNPERVAEALASTYFELNRGDAKVRQEIENVLLTIDAAKMDSSTPERTKETYFNRIVAELKNILV